MNAKISKFMAVAITAMFCITAVAVFAVGEDSSAADTTHKVYVEIINTDGTVDETGWVQFTSDGTAAGFIKEANKAFALYGYDVVFSAADSYIGIAYGTSYNNATYSIVDGAWTAVTDTVATYPAAAYLALCLDNGYISTDVYNALEDADKASWTFVNYGYGYDYIKVPEGKTSECPKAPEQISVNCYVEVISAAGAVTETAWVEFDTLKTVRSFVANANEAFETADLDVEASEGKYGVSIAYDGSGNCSTYYGKDGKWVAVASSSKDYFNEYIGLAVGNGYIGKTVYDALSADAKKAWNDTGYAGDYQYQKIVDAEMAVDKTAINCFVEKVDEKGKVTESKWVEINAQKTNQSLIYNANKAFDAAGLEELEMSKSKYGIGVTYDGSGNCSTYYAKDGKWVAVASSSTDYLNDEIALAVGNGYIGKTVYDALSADEQKAWKDTGYAGDYQYQKIVTEPVDGYKPASSDNNNNTGLIIGIVVAVIVVIAIGAFVFYKKK